MTNNTLTAPSGRLVTALVFVTCVVGLLVTWEELHILGSGIIAAGGVISAITYHQIGWKRLVLEDEILLVHDRIRRVRRVPYSAINAIVYVKQTVFNLRTDSYGDVWFDPNAPGLEDFISEISARILRERKSLDLHGDLEIEQGAAHRKRADHKEAP